MLQHIFPPKIFIEIDTRQRADSKNIVLVTHVNRLFMLTIRTQSEYSFQERR
jgi:hypothetical protein